MKNKILIKKKYENYRKTDKKKKMVTKKQIYTTVYINLLNILNLFKYCDYLDK